MKRQVMSPEDSKNQLEKFGMVMRDEEFFKRSEEIVKMFTDEDASTEEE